MSIINNIVLVGREPSNKEEAIALLAECYAKIEQFDGNFFVFPISSRCPTAISVELHEVFRKVHGK